MIFAIIFTAVFASNFVLVEFLGICPFLGVSKSVKNATGMGLAVTAIFTNDGFNLFSFGAGELGLVRHAFCFRAVCSFRQSPLPPVPFDIDTQGRRMR